MKWSILAAYDEVGGDQKEPKEESPEVQLKMLVASC